MQFDDVIKNRHSVRAYLDKPVEEEKLQQILEVANLAPSAGNLQAREIFVVKDKKKKETLAKTVFKQDSILQAPVVLVFFANPERSGEKYGARGNNFYSLQDAALSAFSAWLKAVDLGLSCVWIGGFKDEEVVETMGVNKKWKTIVILPLGYAAEKPTIRPRRLLNDIVHWV